MPDNKVAGANENVQRADNYVWSDVLKKFTPRSSASAQKVPTQSLDDILKNMSVLNEDVHKYDETVQVISEGTSGERQVIYDEYITNDIAHMLLNKDYDPACRYQMVTDSYQTVIVKIDDSIPADEEPEYDKYGRIIKGHIVEYVLSSDNSDDAISYADMLRSMQNVSTRRHYNDPNVYRDVYTKNKKPLWIKLLIGFVIVVGLTWILLMLYIF